jgi:predicted nucleic acid-binding protein
VVDLFIADSSPLILLARISQIDLLSALAGKVLIPESVLHELRAGSHRDGAASVVEKAPGLEVVPDLQVPPAVQAWDLDPGESQVLAHALTHPGSWAV